MDGRYRLGELPTSRSASVFPSIGRRRSSPPSPPPGCCSGPAIAGPEALTLRLVGLDRPERGSASSSSGRESVASVVVEHDSTSAVVGLGARTGSGAAGRPLVRPVDRPGGPDDRAGDEPRDRSGHHHRTDPGRSPAPARTTAGPRCGGGPARPPGPDQLPGVHRSGPYASRSGLAADAGPALPHPRRLGPAGRRLGGRPGDDAGPVPPGADVRWRPHRPPWSSGRMRGPGSDASGRSIRPAGVVGPRAQNGDRSARTPRNEAADLRSAPPDERHRRPAGAVQPASRGPARVPAARLRRPCHPRARQAHRRLLGRAGERRAPGAGRAAAVQGAGRAQGRGDEVRPGPEPVRGGAAGGHRRSRTAST